MVNLAIHGQVEAATAGLVHLHQCMFKFSWTCFLNSTTVVTWVWLLTQCSADAALPPNKPSWAIDTLEMQHAWQAHFQHLNFWLANLLMECLDWGYWADVASFISAT